MYTFLNQLPDLFHTIKKYGGKISEDQKDFFETLSFLETVRTLRGNFGPHLIVAGDKYGESPGFRLLFTIYYEHYDHTDELEIKFKQLLSRDEIRKMQEEIRYAPCFQRIPVKFTGNIWNTYNNETFLEYCLKIVNTSKEYGLCECVIAWSEWRCNEEFDIHLGIKQLKGHGITAHNSNNLLIMEFYE